MQHSSVAKPRLEVTVHIASINTRAATELAVRSAINKAGMPLKMRVGDCNSSDGSILMLEKFKQKGVLELEIASGPREHAAWLDKWIAECETEWAVFLDSDVQLVHANWLRDMMKRAQETSAAVVGGESTPDMANGITARGEKRYLVGCAAAPWVILCHVPSLRAAGAAFAPVHKYDEPGAPRFYDVASWQQHELQRLGYIIALMPASHSGFYRHFRGLSWRRDTGFRGFVRHFLRLGLLYVRLLRERLTPIPTQSVSA